MTRTVKQSYLRRPGDFIVESIIVISFKHRNRAPMVYSSIAAVSVSCLPPSTPLHALRLARLSLQG